jgi:glutamate-ammonia-ligase adenylyltransferase
MHPDQLRTCLASLDDARPALLAWGVRDAERGWRNLTHLSASLGTDKLLELCPALARLLPRSPDPDMALNNLERFLAHKGAADLVPLLLENRARALEILLRLFGTSQSCSDLLSANPDYLDMLRIPLRRSPSPAELQTQLQAEVDAARSDDAVLRAFRRFRQRQMLRIGTNDIVRDRPLEEITRDLSRVADVAVEVALTTALRTLSRKFGPPHAPAGTPSRCCVLAFGKQGGEELNYSSDLDLMFLYDEEGQTRSRAALGNNEFFARVVGEVVRLLSAHTDRGQAFRVDLRLRPEGQRGPLARSLASTLSYYDDLGRTWERQALIKVRPCAGDLDLGRRFVESIEPFVYRRYLSFAEINEIKVMKRRIEQQATRNGGGGVAGTEVKTGHGGIRDIEFTIQFLQLLNGGDLPVLRQRNTLAALEALEEVGCLTHQEYRVLDDAYRFLRKTEHRLQLLFDLQTHRLPEKEDELRKLARRMGYREREPSRLERPTPPRPRSPLDDAPPEPPHDLHALLVDPLDAFLQDYRDKTEPTRRILDHLLHDAFPGDAGDSSPESDLVLDPNPESETIRAVLGRYPFRDVQAALQNLQQLARESVPFLSTRRCRHFLASVAPGLLRAVAETPDPDLALLNLEKVTASLGAKTVLWELFSFNPPSLKLYVELCAWSEFLSEMLINNPGMIDELLDSLVLNQPRTIEELRSELADLCRGADDPDPILHSFQDKESLRIGVRDILGKDSIRQTTAALSDLAETILAQVATLQYGPLEKRLGTPLLAEGPRAGQRCRYVLLALGKLGGHELSYHSDLDVMLVYEGDGRTAPPPGSTRFDRFEGTDHFHFFTELAQRLIRAMSVQGPRGRLYQVDMRLRPTGRSGSLVIPLCEFCRYYAADPQGNSGAHLWERQALTRARIVHGDADFRPEAAAAVEAAAYGLTWSPERADEIVAMRKRLEASRTVRDLKRGPGGLMDVEFLVQAFQLKYGRHQPALRTANTWLALESLHTAGLLTETEFVTLRDAYDFLMQAKSRLRIVHNRALDELPAASEEVEKLARRLGFEGEPAARFLAELERHTSRTRELFLELVAREREPGRPGEGLTPVGEEPWE